MRSKAALAVFLAVPLLANGQGSCDFTTGDVTGCPEFDLHQFAQAVLGFVAAVLLIGGAVFAAVVATKVVKWCGKAL